MSYNLLPQHAVPKDLVWELNDHACNGCQCAYPEHLCRAQPNCAWSKANPLDRDENKAKLHRQARRNSYWEYKQRQDERKTRQEATPPNTHLRSATGLIQPSKRKDEETDLPRHPAQYLWTGIFLKYKSKEGRAEIEREEKELAKLRLAGVAV